jgi:hypothetical protein
MCSTRTGTRPWRPLSSIRCRRGCPVVAGIDRHVRGRGSSMTTTTQRPLRAVPAGGRQVAMDVRSESMSAAGCSQSARPPAATRRRYVFGELKELGYGRKRSDSSGRFRPYPPKSLDSPMGSWHMHQNGHEPLRRTIRTIEQREFGREEERLGALYSRDRPAPLSRLLRGKLGGQSPHRRIGLPSTRSKIRGRPSASP